MESFVLNVVQNSQLLPSFVLNVVQHKNKKIITSTYIRKKIRAGKIEEIEASIHISNVSHVDPDNGKPTRVKYEIKDGVKKRMSVVSGSLLDK